MLEHWQAQAKTGHIATILPDGCRDLIFTPAAGWFITELAKTCEQVDMKPDDCYNGFRLRPGVQVDQAGLLASLSDDLTDNAILERLQTYVTPVANVTEALSRLSSGMQNVAQAAADLGVQARSLQRLLKQQTGRSPVFWLRLARVRRAASRLTGQQNLAELAYDMGYADQAHMTREFRYWLGATPRQISRDAGWLAQHLGRGYGA
ncbi:MAG: helix-turn-helix transcriptional regulator [Marinosulfonomonas sp.]|nr:helix-turn-helix transcriptional regulator [Marinosulfonomonas sp.]